MDIMKLKGQLGQDTIEEMDMMDDAQLHKVVVEAESAMKQAKEELEANPKYQEAKENVKALSQGKRDLDKRQKGKIQYALSRLTEIGKLGSVDKMAWETTRMKFWLAKEEKERERKLKEAAKK